MIVKYTPTPNPVREQFMVLQASAFKTYEDSINAFIEEQMEDHKTTRTPILDSRINAFQIFFNEQRNVHKNDFDIFKNVVSERLNKLVYFIWKSKY